MWLCQKVCDALHYLLDMIYLKDLAQNCIEKNVGFPMATNRAPLNADLFFVYYERAFTLSLSDNNQANSVEALNSTS